MIPQFTVNISWFLKLTWLVALFWLILAHYYCFRQMFLFFKTKFVTQIFITYITRLLWIYAKSEYEFYE